jgi:cation diffusion facilitator CzcD-associated flavoprotein CzcO
MSRPSPSPSPMGQLTADVDVDVVIVGAGFAGMYALYQLRSKGLRVRCFEAGSDVGGTWYWNRYPGARCDVESIDYSYTFSPELEQEWSWTERYATQPEILRYQQFVADRLDLRRDITFSTVVQSVRLDETGLVWDVGTSGGQRVRARFVVLASGALSAVNRPDLPGLDGFKGRVLHTGAWPHEPVDFTGRTVAVIGTGSSGIQLIPQVAETARQVLVLQRTPNFSIPARNYRYDPEQLAQLKAAYAERRSLAWRSVAGTPFPPPDKSTFGVGEEERWRIFEEKWGVGGARFTRSFTDLMSDELANAEAVRFVHDKIRATVRDPAVAERLLPRDHPLGSKRICVDIDYYEAFNRDNVVLVDLREDPIERFGATSVRLRSGSVEIDDLVLATGYDAVTGALTRIDLRGRNGRLLSEEWAAGPQTYLGMTVAGFPNLFIVNGPGSPSVLANMVFTSEHQVRWISDAIADLDRLGKHVLEATPEAQRDWGEHCSKLAEGSLMLKANSWYVGANIPGKPRVFLPFIGGLPRYMDECAEVARGSYRGFAVS